MKNNFETIVKQALAEDIGSGDHSSLASIDPTIQGEMKLLVKEPGSFVVLTSLKRLFARLTRKSVWKPIFPMETGSLSVILFFG